MVCFVFSLFVLCLCTSVFIYHSLPQCSHPLSMVLFYPCSLVSCILFYFPRFVRKFWLISYLCLVIYSFSVFSFPALDLVLFSSTVIPCFLIYFGKSVLVCSRVLVLFCIVYFHVFLSSFISTCLITLSVSSVRSLPAHLPLNLVCSVLLFLFVSSSLVFCLNSFPWFLGFI